ncbi:MAG: type II and III secretion system protein [Treponema sp.]|nr:type II and III secretion system protein [Treponema sp.]
METIFSSLKLMKRGLMILIIMALFPLFAVGGKGYFTWDFSDCEIKDILYAVSLDTGISIVPDDTVSGRGDLKFTGSDFNSAFDAFLLGNRLFVRREEKMWVVSKFKAWEENGLFNLDACDLLPAQIVEKLSVVCDFAITYDSLPAQKLSVHLRAQEKTAMVENLARVFGNYELKVLEGGLHISKKTDNWKNSGGSFSALDEGTLMVNQNENGAFFVDVKDVLFSEVVERLFSLKKEGPGFCLLGNGEVKVMRSFFYGLDFDGTLDKLCSQNGYGFFEEDDIYYIYADGNTKNSLLSKNRHWQKFPLCFAKSKDILPLLSMKFAKLETIVLQNNEGFLCNCNEKEALQINQLIGELDVQKSTYLVNLKYIKPKELLEYLPPDIDREALIAADDKSCLYFNGTEEAYKNLCKQIEVCDRPLARLSYDLLILQYDDVKQNQWATSLGAKVRSLGDRNDASVSLGSVMSLNMNVVTAFGLTFAAGLQNSIEENRSKVFADTTLHGVSGKQITFQSTNTYRYRDNNVDPDTGKPIYSGVTRELSSGIKLEVLGWVSGEGMITTSVSASISRQGLDTSSSTGNPPPTSEKLVTTEVCGKSGEPIILSGLVQDSDEENIKRTPFLSKLPLLGWLFKSRGKSSQKDQMVIYLVPHLLDQVEAEKDLYDEKWLSEKTRHITGLLQKEGGM